jgi:type IV secretory pathway VirB2 component (pilin)
MVQQFQHAVARRSSRTVITIACVAVLVLLPTLAFAQADPWTNIGFKFSNIFTGPLPRYLGLAAIAIGGISHAFGEHGMSSKWANIFIGVGTSVFAVQGYSYFFL